jgi:predicted Zn-dependent protease
MDETRNNQFTRIIYILIGIMLGLGSRYIIDYTYSAMRKGGLTPELPFVYTDKRGDVRKTDVYLVPIGKFSEIAASQLSMFLSQDLGITVKATGCKPMPAGTYDEKRKQHVAERFYEPLLVYSKTLHQDCKPNAIFIGIIADDMYMQETNWNFCFTSNFKNGISVVATDRLVPYGVLDRAAAGKVYGARLIKILKRTIGFQYSKRPRSSDPNSLLYSPLMKLDELDRMSFQY